MSPEDAWAAADDATREGASDLLRTQTADQLALLIRQAQLALLVSNPPHEVTPNRTEPPVNTPARYAVRFHDAGLSEDGDLAAFPVPLADARSLVESSWSGVRSDSGYDNTTPLSWAGDREAAYASYRPSPSAPWATVTFALVRQA